MKPFDSWSVLLAKHAQRVAITTFSVLILAVRRSDKIRRNLTGLLLFSTGHFFPLLGKKYPNYFNPSEIIL
jgi:hypothetical protein